MAAHSTYKLGNGHTLTIIQSAPADSVVAFHVEERDETGAYVATVKAGTLRSCEGFVDGELMRCPHRYPDQGEGCPTCSSQDGVHIETLREGDLIEWRGEPARVLEFDTVEFGLVALTLRTPDGIVHVTDDPDRRVPLLKGGGR